MAGSRFEGLFDELSAGFEAAITRQEDEAADDLATALQQDMKLQVASSRGGWRLQSPEGSPAPVVEVGEDYVSAILGDVNLVSPWHRAVLAADASVPSPSTPQRGLVELLRAHVRGGATPEVITERGSFRGRLARATADHLVVRGPDRDVIIPLAAVLEVRFACK